MPDPKPAVVRDHRATGIEHIFVLMLENRSFDHMLGFSGITGTDAVTGKKTSIDGLTGTEFNRLDGHTYTVQKGADDVMPLDPGHEFEHVLMQMAGPGPDAVYAHGGAYPATHNSGYVASYIKSTNSNVSKNNPGEIMKCYDTRHQLPVLFALAEAFVVCDKWYASVPGPTWPNRMFAHAGSSGGLDHSPSTAEIVEWEVLPDAGFGFKHGTLYDRLHKAKVNYRLYAGDDTPMVSGLKGVSITEIRDFSEHFAKDLLASKVDFKYAFIEPHYDALHDYKSGSSQHPLANVTRGEALIKATYEAIRNSPVWEKSLLIITWDEHGGFFDHADSGRPPQCVAPGDSTPGSKYNQHGFTFEHYGPRVPAVVVSPLIPPNLIDHRVYDHSSIPATVARVFGTEEMTLRDGFANGLNALASLKTARSDAPKTLPSPSPVAIELAATAEPVSRPDDSVEEGNLPSILHAAMRQDMEVSGPQHRQEIIARVQSIHTRAQAMEYMNEVRQKVRPRRVPGG